MTSSIATSTASNGPSGRSRRAECQPQSQGYSGLPCSPSGVIVASLATPTAARIALSIATLILVYDVWGKRSAVVAPLNMGLCRACNLLLGIAAAPAALTSGWPVALIPLAYIAAVTALSRGEVHGGRRGPAGFALISLSAALAGSAFLAVRSGHRWMASSGAGLPGGASRTAVRPRQHIRRARPNQARRQARCALVGLGECGHRHGLRRPSVRGCDSDHRRWRPAGWPGALR